MDIKLASGIGHFIRNHLFGSAIELKAIIICKSIHHKNTEKVAKAMAEVLGASLAQPEDIDWPSLAGYDLLGFGSGIYSAKHHELLLALADKLTNVASGKAFIFSTSAIMGKDKVAGDHSALREKLQAKGYTIVDEFACKGFNTNSFLKYFGGMNKGRPYAEDLENARKFAKSLID